MFCNNIIKNNNQRTLHNRLPIVKIPINIIGSCWSAILDGIIFTGYTTVLFLSIILVFLSGLYHGLLRSLITVLRTDTRSPLLTAPSFKLLVFASSFLFFLLCCYFFIYDSIWIIGLEVIGFTWPTERSDIFPQI